MSQHSSNPATGEWNPNRTVTEIVAADAVDEALRLALIEAGVEVFPALDGSAKVMILLTGGMRSLPDGRVFTIHHNRGMIHAQASWLPCYQEDAE